MLNVFCDANIFFAAFSSPEGGSSIILKLAQQQKIHLIASRIVLKEADRNLRNKTNSKILKTFHRYIKETKIHIFPPINDATLSKYSTLIHTKDTPVLAAAIEAKSDYLITLDRKHFLTPKILSYAKNTRTQILTPKGFLNKKTILHKLRRTK